MGEIRQGGLLDMSMTLKAGTIGTIAGTGEPAFSGDGGRAVAASLNEPKSLALDGRGHLFIADAENQVIRKVDITTGLITTVAGRPPMGSNSQPGGCATDQSDPADPAPLDPLADEPLDRSGGTTPKSYRQEADLSGMVRYVVGASTPGNRIQTDGGPATEATLNFPSAIAVDADGHLYIADTMNHRIRKVDVDTGLITTIAGTGHHRFSGDGGPATSASLNEPAALALDSKGSLYIADQSNNRIRKIELKTGLITTVAGTGEAAYSGDGQPAIEACLAGPSGLAIDPDGHLYIADTFNGRIRRVDAETGLITTVAGDGGEYRYQGLANEFSTSLSRPYGIAVNSEGHLLITDSDSHLIRKWDRRKKIITNLVGTGVAQFGGDGGAGEEASLNYPFGVAVDQQGNLYIADTFNHRIRLLAA